MKNGHIWWFSTIFLDFWKIGFFGGIPPNSTDFRKIDQIWWVSTKITDFLKNQFFWWKPTIFIDFSKIRKFGGNPPDFDHLVTRIFAKNALELQLQKSLKTVENHRKIRFFENPKKWWKTTIFWHLFLAQKHVFLVDFHHKLIFSWKLVEIHHFCRFLLIISDKTFFGGFPPKPFIFLEMWWKPTISVGFSKNPKKWWKTTEKSDLSEKP